MSEESRALLFDAVLTGLAALIAGADLRTATLFPKSQLAVYDGFELFARHLAADDDYVLLGNNAADMPVWPIDARWGGPWHRDDDDDRGLTLPEGSWYFKRVNTLNPKHWRGRLRLTLPRMVEMHEAGIMPDGKALTSVAPIGILKHGLADCLAHNHHSMGREVPPGDVYTDAARSDAGDLSLEWADIRLAQGVALRREYLWSVLLGEEGVPRARFVTDPLGVREAFRLRDIPPGKARRAALRHWVQQHWRKQRDPSEQDRIFVRAYLRGATAFGWNGLSCVIEPSHEDRRRNREALMGAA